MKREFIINITPLKFRRRELRDHATRTEKILWEKLRRKQFGYWFKRQVSITAYIVDFYCPQKRLAIEIDGGYHKNPSQIKYDTHRTKYLAAFGIKELRFANNEVENNINQVLTVIHSTLASLP